MRTKTAKITKNTEETSRLAKVFLDEILKHDAPDDGALVVALFGELGAGKTTFVQAVARHLGVKNKVNSPTFLIIKKYAVKNKKYKFLFHLDAYRLKSENELLRLGWEEIVSDKKHLIFIEWPENVSGIIPRGSKSIHISHDKERQRHFEIDLT
jgi:tRNA threonylcarbamoyladenosine biosynthesis protein TsaE